MDYPWAAQYPEVYKICKLFNLTELSRPSRYRYKSLPSIIQTGPKCGIVALAMCSEDLSAATVSKVMLSAGLKGYTYLGEMFSASNMVDLARELLPEWEVQLFKGHLDVQEIKEFLLGGNLMLVPYDTDKDNSPCCLRGYKAHWAVLCGAVETDDDFYVIARHGKVRNVAIWKLSQLAISNSQLLESQCELLDPAVNEMMPMKLPEGGIGGPLGLNSQAVMIYCSSTRS